MILYCPSIGHYTERNLIIFFKWHLKFFTCVNSLKIKPSFIFWCRLKSLYIAFIGCTYTQSCSPTLLSEGSHVPISSQLPIDNMFFDYTQAYATIFFPWTDYLSSHPTHGSLNCPLCVTLQPQKVFCCMRYIGSLPPKFKKFVYFRINRESMEVTTCHINTNFINFVHEYHHEMQHKQFLPDLPTYCSYQLPIKLCTI